MMQEVGSRETTPESQLGATQIADELQEAAQTFVSSGSTSSHVTTTTMSAAPSNVQPSLTAAASLSMGQEQPPFSQPQIFTPMPVPTVGQPQIFTPPPNVNQHVPMATAYNPIMTPEALTMPREAAIDLPTDSQEPLQEDHVSGGGIFGWFKNNELVNRVVEKTKHSMEAMITTMDPGMKQVINTGGDIDFIVTSAKDAKVEPVREAFQAVFGRADIRSMASQPNIAPQPVGWTAGLKGAQERIDNLRNSGAIHGQQPAISIESFIVELFPDRWFDIGCIILRDPVNNIDLDTFTQATPISHNYIQQAQDKTAPDYNLSWSGLQVTIGDVIHQNHPNINPTDWHAAFTGVSRRDMILAAAKTIAFMYKQNLPPRT